MNVAVAFDVVRKAGWSVHAEKVRHNGTFGVFHSVVMRSPRCDHCGNQHTIAAAVAPGASALDLQRMAAGMRNQFKRHIESGCRH